MMDWTKNVTPLKLLNGAVPNGSTWTIDHDKRLTPSFKCEHLAS